MNSLTLTPAEVSRILDQIKSVNVLFIGDVCLDLYWRADMKRSRLSRETPHYPLPVVDESYSPGAGGNVLSNIRALGVENLTGISLIANDWRGFLLTRKLNELQIDTSRMLCRQSGVTPCYCKPLRMGISDVVYEDPRLDFENYQPLTPTDEDNIIKALEEASKTADIIAVSDQFSQGVITPRVREKLSQIAQTVPVVADSRDNAMAFTNAILKPNELEAAAAVGKSNLEVSQESYAQIARELSAKTRRPAVVTLGELGAIWCDGEDCTFAPTVKAEPPTDIVGAGDTFLSAFCCAYAACKDGARATAFANLASAVTVKKIGTTGTASPEEILKKSEEYQK